MTVDLPDVLEEFFLMGPDDETLPLSNNPGALSHYFKDYEFDDLFPNSVEESVDSGNLISPAEFLPASTGVINDKLDSTDPVGSPTPIPAQNVVEEKPKVVFVRQPKWYRSRYASEIDTAATIRCNENKPLAIEVTGLKSDYQATVIVRLHCVQCDDTDKLHPNNCFLRGNGVTNKDISENGGVVTCTAVVAKEHNQIRLDKLAILRATRSETSTNLMKHHNALKNIGQEWQTNQCIEQSNQINFSQFRICVEVFIEKVTESNTNGVTNYELVQPIFSNIIKDNHSKRPLQIINVSDHTSQEEGGKEVTILCNKIDGRKENMGKNVEVHLKFSETDQCWGTGKITMFHHHVAIVTKLPKFPRAMEPDSHAHVLMALYNKSEGPEEEKYSNHVEIVYYSGTLQNSKCTHPQDVTSPREDAVATHNNSKSSISPKLEMPCVYSKLNGEASTCSIGGKSDVLEPRDFPAGGSVTAISSSMNSNNGSENNHVKEETYNSPSTSGRQKPYPTETTRNLLQDLKIHDSTKPLPLWYNGHGTIIPCIKKRTSSGKQDGKDNPIKPFMAFACPTYAFGTILPVDSTKYEARKTCNKGKRGHNKVDKGIGDSLSEKELGSGKIDEKASLVLPTKDLIKAQTFSTEVICNIAKDLMEEYTEKQ